MLPVENLTSIPDDQLERRLTKKFGVAHLKDVTEAEVRDAADEILAHRRRDIESCSADPVRTARMLSARVVFST